MSRKPYVFIGSSSEGKRAAEAIQLNLKDTCESQIWDQGLFGLSDGTFDTLIRALDSFDFAVFIISGDDLIESRGVQSTAPRDNVIFELGLFIGSLGRTRVYMICDRSAKPKLPSDLAGVTAEFFDRPDRANWSAALGPASTMIKYAIEDNGLRQVVNSSKDSYKTDLELISNYLKDKGLEAISFEKMKNINEKFDKDYAIKIIDSNPSQIRRTILRGNKPGVKVLNLYDGSSSKKRLIWKDSFDNLNHWTMNFWGSKIPQKTNRVENNEMIFEASPGELTDPGSGYGAFIDITEDIQYEKQYEVKCKVNSIPDTTMGFQLWVQDGKDGAKKVLQPVFPRTPAVSTENFKLIFTGTVSNTIRVHLYCKPGTGMIRVSEVSIYEL